MDDFKYTFPFRTVCEVTREIHDLLVKNRSRIGEDLFVALESRTREQMTMQKKMDRKLMMYHMVANGNPESSIDHLPYEVGRVADGTAAERARLYGAPAE